MFSFQCVLVFIYVFIAVSVGQTCYTSSKKKMTDVCTVHSIVGMCGVMCASVCVFFAWPQEKSNMNTI